MKRTHRHAMRAGWIGLLPLLFALAAAGQIPESAGPAPGPPEAAPAVAAQIPGGPLGADLAAAAAAPHPMPSSAASPSGVSLIEQAWLAPAPDFDTRLVRTQRAALELGAWSLDGAARSLAAAEASTSALDRAGAAVLLAPDLPVAHMQHARQLWLEGGAPMAAIRAVVSAMRAIGRHVEASLWFTGSGLFVLAVALVAGGLLAVALAGTVGLAHAAHDLGHLFPRVTPAFACWAGLFAVLALPLVWGEGALGIALALLGVAVIYGRRAQRLAMVCAAVGIGFGAYPLMRQAGSALAALPGDPVAQAAYAVAHGIATPTEIARLENLAARDPLAARGLAMHARRLGDLVRADALYTQLLASGVGDPAAQNNAADVQLALGHTERAIELYGLASRTESPVVLFNLAQAYGRAFRVEELNQTIARAQRAGGELVARLTALQGGSASGFVADLPPENAVFWSRALDSAAGDQLAQEFRDHFAPGRLGRDPRVFLTSVAALVLLGALFASRFQPSHACHRCRERICRRCRPHGTSGDVCDGCYTLFFAPEKTDRGLRAARVSELREREIWIGRVHTALSLLVPGAAGQLAKRPMLGWLGALFFALATAAFTWRAGVVPDPGVAGAAAPAVFVGTAMLAALLYAIAVTASLAARRHD